MNTPTPIARAIPSAEEAARLDAEAAQRRLSFLYDASTAVFGADIDVATRIQRLATVAVPDIADWCLVELVDGPKLRRAALTHWSPPCEEEGLFSKESFVDDQPLAAWAMKTGRCVGPLDARPIWEKHVPAGWQALASHSFIVLPLQHAGRVFGVVTLGFVESMREFRAAEVALAQDLVARAAQSLESARLYDLATAARREAEQALAREQELQKKNTELVQKLEVALAARDAFLAVAAHDIRGPINNVMLQMERLNWLLAESSPPQIELSLGGVQKAKRQLRRVADLLHDLLDVTRMRTGKLQLQPKPMDLTALCEDIVVRFAEEAAASGSTLTLASSSPVRGSWDSARIDQVVTNLISNALKYGNGKPVVIEVDVAQDPRLGEQARLRVRDQGLGVAAADQERIFDRFERATTTQEIQGIGVGLWIVKQIVLAHGGTVVVDSAPGCGATFVVTLPLQPAYD